MSFTLSAPQHHSHFLAVALTIAGSVLVGGRSSAADRFIVPVPDSPPSAPSPSPSSPSSSSASSNSESSSSSSSSDSGSSSPGSSSSHPSDHRFNVPVPGGRPSRSYGNVGSGHSHGSGWYDWYAVGCYYWDGRYYYGDGYYYSPFGAGIGFDRGNLPTRDVYASSAGGNRLPIFFPPVPPPLDTPAPAPPVGEAALVAPDELALYIDEPFYAPLSTRLAQGNLTDTLRRRLDAYQAAKMDLQAQLQGKLVALSSADAATKESALAAFAREQTPRLVALEATAEQLRSDLLRGGLVGVFSGTGDWNEHRTWRLGTGRLARDGDETLAAKFRVARAAVFYQDGLSPAQRRLLREVAMELQVQAFKPAGAASPADDGLMFFSPDTARVRLPANLPPALAEKMAAYHREKSMLKSQLRETLFQQDRATKGARAQALKQLAATQTPRLAALDQLAEDIRRDLAMNPNHSIAPNTIAFPPRLASRIAAYQKDRAALQEAIHAKLEEISRILPPTYFKVVQNPNNPTGENTLALELRTMAGSSENRQLAQQAITRFNHEHRGQAAALAQEYAGIRAATTEFAAVHPELMQGKSVESLMQEFVTASIQKEARPLYADYNVAVFQPGLSPEQRRLLFGAALQKLGLPLPGGELQP
jgi:hypothetical protein